MKVWGFTPEIGLLLGTASGALLGLVVGFFAIRRTGIYSTMITLALAQMLFFICLQAPPVARMACKACRAASCSACWTCRTTSPCTT
jgi:ABC-type branched-subunit amino acid transport system permease subunit